MINSLHGSKPLLQDMQKLLPRLETILAAPKSRMRRRFGRGAFFLDSNLRYFGMASGAKSLILVGGSKDVLKEMCGSPCHQVSGI